MAKTSKTTVVWWIGFIILFFINFLYHTEEVRFIFPLWVYSGISYCLFKITATSTSQQTKKIFIAAIVWGCLAYIAEGYGPDGENKYATHKDSSASAVSAFFYAVAGGFIGLKMANSSKDGKTNDRETIIENNYDLTTSLQNNENDTVTDTQTGLMWKKYCEGQGGSNCKADCALMFNWYDALEQAKNINNQGGFAGYKNWRLPSKNELKSIICNQNIKPMINQKIFPNTPPNIFWTSSSSDSSNIIGFDGQSVVFLADCIDFSNGDDRSAYQKHGHVAYVRLVRNV